MALPSWSQWQRLDKESLPSIPEMLGVYEISCQEASCIVYIGSAAGRNGLRQRLGQRISNPERYLSGHEKKLRKQGCHLMFRCAEASSKEQAKSWESSLINEYKSHHGHLPHGNTQTPRPSVSC